MTAETSVEQTTAQAKEARKSKRAGQSCITLFVVAVIVVAMMSFGKVPFVMSGGSDGSRLDFDLASCLGILMGFYAMLFMLTNIRRILSLPTARKVLGLIGGLGLIAHTVIALAAPLSYGVGTAGPVGSGGYMSIGRSGAEQWVVDGNTYAIASTYYLHLPQGLQYTIEYPVKLGASLESMNDKRALGIAFPLIKHAYVNGLYERLKVTKAGQGAVVPSRIGVTLVEWQEGNARGYRVAMSLNQIKKRIEQEAAANSTSRPTSSPMP
jgi:hypothetical protein